MYFKTTHGMRFRHHSNYCLVIYRFNIDIAALSDEGSLSEIGETFTFFWKSLPSSSPRIHGFAIRSSLLQKLPESPVAINERLTKLHDIVSVAKSRFLTLASPYAPILTADDTTKNQFYDTCTLC